MIANQMATKILNAENKPANFDTGDKAVMMPQLGGYGRIHT
jgi:RAD51-like protein 2